MWIQFPTRWSPWALFLLSVLWQKFYNLIVDLKIFELLNLVCAVCITFLHLWELFHMSNSVETNFCSHFNLQDLSKEACLNGSFVGWNFFGSLNYGKNIIYKVKKLFPVEILFTLYATQENYSHIQCDIQKYFQLSSLNKDYEMNY